MHRLPQLPLFAAALACAALIGLTACETEALRTPVAPTGAHLTVATYNVNYGLADDASTLAAVLSTDADVVCLQETTPAWEQAINGAVGSDYPFRQFIDGPGAGGLAVLSRLPFVDAGVIPGVDGWFPAWRVIVDSPLGDVQLVLVHLRPPVSNEGSFVSGYFQRPDVHRAEMALIVDAMDDTLPSLVLGDFNENPGGAALAALEEGGARSVLPEFEEDAETWRWDLSGIPLSGTYDHIVYGERLEPLWAEVREVGRSDHLPVVAGFGLAR